MKSCFTLLFTFMLLPFCNKLFAQASADGSSQFYIAKFDLEQMLTGEKPLSYERAVYEIENAYLDNTLDYAAFENVIDWQSSCIKRLSEAGKQNNPKALKDDLLMTAAKKQSLRDDAFANWAIYAYLCDTSFIKSGDSISMILPYKYNKKDPLGSLDWKSTTVSNLLATGQGNCFALASLYKIHAERLHSGAILCTAPEHIYIRHADDHGTYFNIELSSHSFPGTGMIATVTYTTNEAIKKNISLRELSDKQEIALAMVYLGKGFENKFGYQNTEFPLSCAEIALKYDSLCLNAMLLKAEILERKTIRLSEIEREGNMDYKAYEGLLKHLYTLGYREMPLEMKNLLIGGWKADSAINHTSNPFKELGVKDTKYASLSWGLFDEEHVDKPVERFGQTLFDTKTMKIKGFAPEEELYNQYKFDPVAFALNIDPLAAKYPNISPYVFVADNPIRYIDPDGAEIVDPKGRIAVITTDNKMVFTKYATDDIRRTITIMTSTKIGNEIAMKMVHTSNKISIKIDNSKEMKFWDPKSNTVTTTYKEGLLMRLGNTHSVSNGKGGLKSSEITIFEGNIKGAMDNRMEKPVSNNEKMNFGDYSIDETIGATMTHEGTHAVDKSSARSLGAKNPEKLPNQNEEKFYKEIDQQKSNQQK